MRERSAIRGTVPERGGSAFGLGVAGRRSRQAAFGTGGAVDKYKRIPPIPQPSNPCFPHLALSSLDSPWSGGVALKAGLSEER